MAATPDARGGQTKASDFGAVLFKAADKMRGSVEPSEYKHIVLVRYYPYRYTLFTSLDRQRLTQTGPTQFEIAVISASLLSKKAERGIGAPYAGNGNCSGQQL